MIFLGSIKIDPTCEFSRPQSRSEGRFILWVPRATTFLHSQDPTRTFAPSVRPVLGSRSTPARRIAFEVSSVPLSESDWIMHWTYLIPYSTESQIEFPVAIQSAG
jgi:hypothetical protein